MGDDTQRQRLMRTEERQHGQASDVDAADERAVLTKRTSTVNSPGALLEFFSLSKAVNDVGSAVTESLRDDALNALGETEEEKEYRKRLKAEEKHKTEKDAIDDKKEELAQREEEHKDQREQRKAENDQMREAQRLKDKAWQDAQEIADETKRLAAKKRNAKKEFETEEESTLAANGPTDNADKVKAKEAARNEIGVAMEKALADAKDAADNEVKNEKGKLAAAKRAL